MNRIRPVILSGGAGTRLWPASRTTLPKQFMKLDGGSSLFAETVNRVHGLKEVLNPIIVSNNEYRFYIDECLKESGQKGAIILEPEGRNTAPAVALAAFATMGLGDDALMLVMPSDHVFQQPEGFIQAVESARKLADTGYLVTFGITPARPETGYGYIKQGSVLGNGYRVERFIEKPQLNKAETMLKEGGYYWNAGIFLFKASVFLDELKRYAPEMFEAVKASWENRTLDLSFIRPGDAFLDCPSDSIDYAIMERSDKVAVVPMDGGWNDLGAWESFYEIAKKDANGNACEGNVLASNISGCYVRSTGRLVAAVDVQDLAIVETKDAVLIADRSKTQDVKSIVNLLKADNRTEADFHPVVYRPWGNYEALALSDRFQVKRITVQPGTENSLQMHYHRAEHWIIVKGTAEITIGQEKHLLTENESIYIPLGVRHRIKNPGTIPLEFIEVQTGSYLSEDDIVRFEDKYGRTDATDDVVEAAPDAGRH